VKSLLFSGEPRASRYRRRKNAHEWVGTRRTRPVTRSTPETRRHT
jgi:hypothetical protein